jgi:hypothetical protein
MDIKKSQVGLRPLSISALVAALLGFAFYWWVPMGMMWSLAGSVLGFADWTRARRRSLDYRLSVLAMLLGIAALVFDIVIAAYHLQTITFGSQ